MPEPRLFYFEIDLKPKLHPKSLLVVARDEDEAYEKLEEYAKGISKYNDVSAEVGKWEEIKEKLNKEEVVEIF